MPRAQSKSRSTSRGRTAKATARSPKKQQASTPRSAATIKKKTATASSSKSKTPSKRSTTKSKSRSQSASRKAHTAPAGAVALKQQNQQYERTTPISRPSRSRSRTRVTEHQLQTRYISTTTAIARPTSSYFDSQLQQQPVRSRRGIANYGTDVANVSARTARYVAKSAQNAPWRVSQWFHQAKQAAVIKWRRSCLHRPNLAKAKRHFANNAKWYLSLFIAALAAIIIYKFQHEILVQMREMQAQLSEFAETQRQIFG